MLWILDNINMKMLLPLVLSLTVLQGVYSQRSRGQSACEESSCYPATGDLLIGRGERLSTTSTCGLRRPQRYCIVSHLDSREKCFNCDSRYNGSSMSHEIQNIVTSYRNKNWRERWWQAENGQRQVSIQLDLEAEFHFTHLIMRFKTFRPAAMLVERSPDFGKSWYVYRYFAHDCRSSFPGVQEGPLRRITDVICDDSYSGVEPSTEGEVVFRVLPPYISIDDPYSEEVQNVLKMTNLRINFTELHTLGDNLLDNREAIKQKYYYSMYDMVVRGSCSCYGHASRCLPLHESDDPYMVHGRCECTHNTKGLNCAECEDFYNDLPWQPAIGRQTNACKKCNCNDHATRCHFDPAVFVATNYVSGGVCDDCQHNTRGRNCELCQPFFYRDPQRPLNDPYVCQACDCDPRGSEHGGECESHTDVANGLVAGRCICKQYVEGPRCGSCKNGYWNMKQDNPYGCEACTCNTLGTVGNFGCDKYSGDCRCKRYVTGRSCDRCYPQFWGLSSSRDGCQACDCDLGGAYDNNCDAVTGECKCKPNIKGRRCELPVAAYFATSLDFLRYEAETARGIGNVRVVIREPSPGRPITWTGYGFMKVTEGNSLEFDVYNVPASMEYDIVIRYEPQMPDRWEDVRVTVIRPGEVDQGGECANHIPQDDFKAASLPPGRGQEEGSRYYVVSPSSCLEKNVRYTIRLDFNRYKSDRATPQASVLVDSIVLVPNTGSIKIMDGPQGIRMKEEYERYRCREQQLSVMRGQLPDVCKQMIFSISSSMWDMALDCDCDPTGSLSMVCNPSGGQCDCKPNVIGRRCDQCAPATFGFGTDGCQACNCDTIGSRDNFCDVTNGQCPCMDNVYGQRCDQCERGYWGFPNCRQCRCNGRADTCDNLTGKCNGCRDSTGGDYCDQCAPGYYGDARPGSSLGCRPCMCPGGVGSGYQHADTCRLDSRTNQVICDCKRGYIGENCDRCADNYYGNPLTTGGECRPCTCNGNINTNIPGSCDSATGECLKCVYHTEGFNCERCVQGYYGDAKNQDCKMCVCSPLGTVNHDLGRCDRVSGQCECLPHVIGRECDQCEPNYWKIASGEGCEACNCDPRGSTSSQCNLFDGQCECLPGRGGRDCSECPANYWGDPDVECRPCNCNSEGSDGQQCDRRTGRCPCVEGVAGFKCDRCARGTTGELPNCVPCGECFDNWDRIISELRDETNRLIDEADNIKVDGLPSAFDKEFKEMEDKLEEVRRIVSGTNVTEEDIADLQRQLEDIRRCLNKNQDNLDTLDGELDQSEEKIETYNIRIQDIKDRVDALKRLAKELETNATNIKELEPTGAYNITVDSQRRSREAQRRVDQTDIVIRQSEQIREQVEDILVNGQGGFDDKYTENEETLVELNIEVDGLEDKIVDLNEQVCDKRGDPCDSSCGGALCGKCGGLLCGEGAVEKANGALKLAKDSEEKLREQANKASTLLAQVKMAEDDTNVAKERATIAHELASQAKNQSENSKVMLEDLLIRIEEFLSEAGASPEDIRNIAEETLAMSISLSEAEIQDLARQINETIRGLTNIDAILDATKDDLDMANDLKRRADAAKRDADGVLGDAEAVLKALEEAERAQNAAESAIDQANDDIVGAEEDLVMIESDTNTATDQSTVTLDIAKALLERLSLLKRKFTENELKVSQAEMEAEQAEDLAIQADDDATDLEVRYNGVSDQLDRKYNDTVTAKNRAELLRSRATNLYSDTERKLNELQGMEIEFEGNRQTMLSLAKEVQLLHDRMVTYLVEIQEVARYHKTCGTA